MIAKITKGKEKVARTPVHRAPDSSQKTFAILTLISKGVSEFESECLLGPQWELSLLPREFSSMNGIDFGVQRYRPWNVEFNLMLGHRQW